MKKHGNRVRRKRPQKRSSPFSPKGGQRAPAETPIYDMGRRELRVGTIVVKCFTQRSDAQEIILASFQEENWRRSIDDPLPVKSNQDPRQRLRRAVDNLNRRQRAPLLHFQVIGQGTSVAWTFRETATVERRKSDA